MNSYLYSPSENAFYPVVMKEDYLLAGTWPEDGLDIDDEQALSFMGDPPEGKVRAAGEDGLPCWVDVPPPTQEELIAQADATKEALILSAKQTISIWQTELQLGIISDEDKASLIAWMNYIKAVQAVDTSKAPDITWPEKPE
ncbi:tail fiber assembly protein [Enterobacter asburiae]|uniref:tail fiber assembly protein n=1 Tax=Enterobacter asburiae TaxID=61645 RepID=UPI001CBD25B2|nr:tail fiber assembly protein [Enterobacter asburiae]UAN17384.1 tail fiber assembly protein [Enterobacter asburiae]